MSAFFRLGAHATVYRPLPVGTALFLPLVVLVWLAVFPPHALDMAIARWFFSDGAFVAQSDPFFRFVLHQAMKRPAIMVAGAALLTALASRLIFREPSQKALSRVLFERSLYILIVLLLSLQIITTLKATTGVHCPWSIVEFGGSAQVTDPTFGWIKVPGRCWPGGHASSGFALFALYFAFRDARPRLARGLFVAAFVLGCVCAGARMMQGAHFLSHNIATFVIDWLLALGVYLVMRRLGCRFGLPAAAQPAPAHYFRLETPSSLGLCLLMGAWWSLVFDAPMWGRLYTAAVNGHGVLSTVTLVVAAACAAALVWASVLMLLSLLPRVVSVPVMVVLHCLGAVAMIGTSMYGISVNADMMRNFLATDATEASAYLSARTVTVTALAWLPPLYMTALYARAVGRDERSWLRRSGWAALACAVCLSVGCGCGMTQLQTLAGIVRTDRTLKYMAAPANVVSALTKTLVKDKSPDAKRERLVLDDAPRLQGWVAEEAKPMLFVVVVGETARSANWGLDGYARDTTPNLAKLDDIIPIRGMQACGTSTDVSLPCMFSRVGRRSYDRGRILQEEALPALLERAGWQSTWIDNQSGCKGVCAGIESRRADKDDQFCGPEGCTDDVLVGALERIADAMRKTDKRVVFLHMIGSHGPKYYARSTESEKRFLPECRESDLGSCRKEAIVNAYDNSILETDRVLARMIETLRARDDLVTGLFFASDHGESLGELGLYLHGAPYLIAPQEQTQVPALLWLSPMWQREMRVDADQIRRMLPTTSAHDHVFHTLLGLLGVQTKAYEAKWDLLYATGRRNTGPSAGRVAVKSTMSDVGVKAKTPGILLLQPTPNGRNLEETSGRS